MKFLIMQFSPASC